MKAQEALILPNATSRFRLRFSAGGTAGNSRGHFCLSQTGGECCWHLVGRGQQGCYIPYSAQNSPTAKEPLAPNRSSAGRGWGSGESLGRGSLPGGGCGWVPTAEGRLCLSGDLTAPPLPASGGTEQPPTRTGRSPESRAPKDRVLRAPESSRRRRLCRKLFAILSLAPSTAAGPGTWRGANLIALMVCNQM